MLFTVPDEHLADPEYHKEYVRLRLAVADITLSWASLETSMCFFLGRILDNGTQASAVFFAPTSLDARIAILDASFAMFVMDMPKAAKAAIAKEWLKLVKSIQAQKQLRNRVAHSALTSIGKNPKAKHKPVLSAAVFDVGRYLKGEFITAHEIEQSINALESYEARLAMLGFIVDDWREQNLEDFEEAIRELPNRARKAVAQKGSQKPPDPDKGTPQSDQSRGFVMNFPFVTRRGRGRQI